MNAPPLPHELATHSEPVSEQTLSYFRLPTFGTHEWPEWFEPPLAKPPERLVILCENKLISIDMVLPLAFELKGERPELEIEFLFLRQDHMASVKDNYFLWSGMEKVGNIRFLSHGGFTRSSPVQKALNLVRVGNEIRTSRRRRTVLLYRRDFSGWPVALIALAVRAGGGALVSFPSLAYPVSSALLRSHLNQEPATVHHRFQADRHLLFHPLQRQTQRRITNAPMAVIGTTRWFPHWQFFLTKLLNDQGLRDIDGRTIDPQEKPNILMFYPGNLDLPDLDGPTACRDQMVRTLGAVRRVAPQARVLIKPHALCDISELKRELESFRDLDIRVTFAHPLALARHSVVCTVPNGTSVIDDMYVAGLPLIDSALNRPDGPNAQHGLFPNQGRLGCTTDAELENAFRLALTAPEKLPASERGHLFWPKAPSLSGLLWKN